MKDILKLQKALEARMAWLNEKTNNFGNSEGKLGKILEVNYKKNYIKLLDYKSDEIEQTIDEFLMYINSLI